MQIKAIDALSNEVIFQMGSSDGIMPSPNAGDIFVTPDGAQFRCLQRAYVLHEETVEVKKLEIVGEEKKPEQSQQRVSVELQYAVCPLGKEAEYDAEMHKRFTEQAETMEGEEDAGT